MHIIIRYMFYIYTWCLNSFCSSIQFDPLRMCLQCVTIPGIKGQYYQDMLLVLLELEQLDPIGLGDSCRPEKKATFVFLMHSWCQHINSTNRSKPCKQTFKMRGKTGNVIFPVHIKRTGLRHMSWSLEDQEPWIFPRYHPTRMFARKWRSHICHLCGQKRLNTRNQKSRCIKTKLCRNKAPVEHILRNNEASQGTEND